VIIWRRRNRDFRAEVVIETLRLWREMTQEYRDAHPFEKYSVDIATEAAYMASQPGKAQKVIMARAWDNVKRMTKYQVQECDAGRNVGTWVVVHARDALSAAQKVAIGAELRDRGKLGEMRARVRTTVPPIKETAFYADVPHVIR
jgi:hypothetical protein